MKNYRFIKEPAGWFIDLPEFLEQGGSKGDLEMVEGADTMLDIIAQGNSAVTLAIEETDFEGAELVQLTEKCDPYVGGGYYVLRNWNGKEVNHTMWLCAVTEFVFGYLPEKIFIKQVL